MDDIEIWKDVVKFEDRYQISSFGRIYSKYKNKVLSPSLDKDGYRYITLHKGKYKKFYRMNRLTAIHFIPNPNIRISPSVI